MNREDLIENWAKVWAVIAVVVLVLLALSLSGCVSYSKVEHEDGKCRAVARGSYFSFSIPAVLEECRSNADR